MKTDEHEHRTQNMNMNNMNTSNASKRNMTHGRPMPRNIHCPSTTKSIVFGICSGLCYLTVAGYPAHKSSAAPFKSAAPPDSPAARRLVSDNYSRPARVGRARPVPVYCRRALAGYPAHKSSAAPFKSAAPPDWPAARRLVSDNYSRPARVGRARPVPVRCRPRAAWGSSDLSTSASVLVNSRVPKPGRVLRLLLIWHLLNSFIVLSQ